MIIRGDNRIVAVSYLNTVPLIYGIEREPGLHAALVLSPPSQCYTNFINGAADIALLPVAAIPSLGNDVRIITDWCIGTNGGVRTVVMMSNDPLEKIRTIYTDPHSITSERLLRLLCGELWDISPEFIPLDDYARAENPAPGEGFLLIGDKVFGYEGRFAFTRDLSDAWKALTGLPFVFAAWVARAEIDTDRIAALNRAMADGVAHIPEAVKKYGHAEKPYAVEYLSRNIDFVFDTQKRKALELFWEMSLKHVPKVNPG